MMSKYFQLSTDCHLENHRYCLVVLVFELFGCRQTSFIHVSKEWLRGIRLDKPQKGTCSTCGNRTINGKFPHWQEIKTISKMRSVVKLSQPREQFSGCGVSSIETRILPELQSMAA